MTDAEEELRQMIDAIDVPESDDNNVQLLPSVEVIRRFNDATQQLLERAESIHPLTQEGRDLHSERSAYLIELERRGLR